MSVRDRGEMRTAIFAAYVLFTGLGIGPWGAAVDAAEVAINLGGAIATPGETVTIAVTLRAADVAVAGTQNRIDFAPPLSIVARPSGEPDCDVAPGIGKEATAFRFVPIGCTPGADCSGVRAFVLSFANVNPIPDHAVLYTCRVAVAPSAAPGDYVLRNAELGASDPANVFVAAHGADAAVAVRPPQLAIVVADGDAGPGDDVEVDVALHGATAVVAGTQNRIDFAPPLRIRSRPDGSPDCTVNPAIHKDATTFRFAPDDCSAAACRAMRAVVLGFDGVAAIADGSVLYTCRVHVDDGAEPGTYRLLISDEAGAGPAGEFLAAAGGDGAIAVRDAALVSIGFGKVRAVAGQRTAVTARLLFAPGAPAVAATENEIGFEPTTAIPPLEDGRPDCVVAPDIHKDASTFAFLPIGCTPGHDCTAVRALVFALDNVSPIANGASLYSCSIQVALPAAVGVYPLENRGAAASDPAGRSIDTAGRAGAVEVICGGDCDGDGVVAIAELVRGINILLGTGDLASCEVFDGDGDGAVSVNEVIQAVSSALRGCTIIH
jgi:hypothetical protein